MQVKRIRELDEVNQSASQSQRDLHTPRRPQRDVPIDSPNEYEPPGTANKQNIPEADLQIMTRNLVRLALSCERTRTPIRREEVTKKVFVNDHKRCFALIFERAQLRLNATFGMEMVELPAKDRSKNLTMTQQRKAAHSQASLGNTQTTGLKSSKSWILRNTLGRKYKQISQRQHMESERNYNTVSMILMIIVVMSDSQCCDERRVSSAFERLGWNPITPAGPLDDIVARMAKQGYIERLRDDQSSEGAFTLYIGPRGKLETLENKKELISVISYIYGIDDDATAQERLERIIHDTLENEDELTNMAEEEEVFGMSQQQNSTQTQDSNDVRRKRSRRQLGEDD